MQVRLNLAVDSLAKRLKFARQHAKLTQTELAERSGVKQSDISKLERGDMVRTTSLPALARALQCDVDWLDLGDGLPDFGRKRQVWPFSDELQAVVVRADASVLLRLENGMRMILGMETLQKAVQPAPPPLTPPPNPDTGPPNTLHLTQDKPAVRKKHSR